MEMYCRNICSHHSNDWCSDDVGMAQTKSSTACTSIILDVFRNDHIVVFHELILRGMKQVKSKKYKEM
jgi:hypothetical protein